MRLGSSQALNFIVSFNYNINIFTTVVCYIHVYLFCDNGHTNKIIASVNVYQTLIGTLSE